MLSIKDYSDIDEFWQSVEPLLVQEEAKNCLLLGCKDTFERGYRDIHPDSVFYGVLKDQKLVGALIHVPPHPTLMSELSSEDISSLVDQLSSSGSRVSGICSTQESANQFKNLWIAQTRCKISVHMPQMIYQISKLATANATGSLVLATSAHRALMTDWCYQYFKDTGLGGGLAEAKSAAERSIGQKNRYLLQYEGEIVAMAGFSGKTPNGVRINWVFTPLEYRGKGFGSAVTAALTQELFRRDHKLVFLFTDANNKTSNAIYRKIGYEYVCDAANFTFRY